jgi:hypothetical protein
LGDDSVTLSITVRRIRLSRISSANLFGIRKVRRDTFLLPD